jgi:membrane-bound lytic murein transglycosylase D
MPEASSMNLTSVAPLAPWKPVVMVALILTCGGIWGPAAEAEGQRPEDGKECVRHSLPDYLFSRPWTFAGEVIPLQRPDVKARIRFQVNFLLFDARSVLTEWLSERGRYSWIFEEIFAKEGIPAEFVLFSPVLSGLPKNGARAPGIGPWMLDKPCTTADGLTMSDDTWHDDRLDFDLSTRCFVARLKASRKDVGGSWLMAAAAYITTPKIIQELKERWNARSFWDLPPVDPAEDLIVRWIALGIISAHRDQYGLAFKARPPVAFDQVTDLILAKDLSVAEIARITEITSRGVLELNPKIRSSAAALPANVNGKPYAHSIAAPKGKGWVLVEKLKTGGYLAEPGKK